MTLTQLATLLTAIHIGMGITNVGYSYMASADAEANFATIVGKPLVHFLGVTGSDRMELGEGGLLNISELLGLLYNLSDGIWGLLSFEYDFLDAIGSEHGLAYAVVLGLRVVGVLLWLQAGRAIANEPMVTALMSSTVGLALIGGTAGLVAALAAVGATN